MLGEVGIIVLILLYGGTEVVVSGTLVVVRDTDFVVAGGLEVVVDGADLEQPIPAVSSENNTITITAALGSLFITAPSFIAIILHLTHPAGLTVTRLKLGFSLTDCGGIQTQNPNFNNPVQGKVFHTPTPVSSCV